ncbi:MAG: molybdopterin-dependent oxidoreductase [Actinophytocola sp.]|nr:molybdopterin-dependent oxidoreductase [Actinophytocola sp.]
MVQRVWQGADERDDAPPRLSVRVAAVVGLVALLASLAAGHLVAGFTGPQSSPYLAVGNSAVDLSPAWLTDFAKNAFGTANKLVLLAGMAIVLALLALLAGVLSRRRPAGGIALIVGLGVVGMAAVLTRPEVSPLAVLAPLSSIAAGALVFGWLHRVALEGVADSAEAAFDTSRRRFVVSSLGVVAGAGVAATVGQWLTGPDVESSRRAVGGFLPLRRAPAIPAGADFAANGTPTLITANRDFYTIHTALVVPRLRAEEWELRLHGMVSRPLTLTFDQLRARPLVERTLTLACVSNPVGGDLISTANFIGVDLAELLDDAGVAPGAEQLFSTSHDGFTAGTLIDVVRERERGAMLAIGMNGEPLPVEHGFPVRMVVPGLYGFVSATKWLTDLEVTTWAEREAYWIPRGWAREAPVKTQSRIDAPGAGDTVESGTVLVAGTAWAPHTGIDSVQVRVDGGGWHRAELATEVSVDTWRMWRAEVEVPPDEHRISCRATDRAGVTQTGNPQPVTPDGATGWHTVTVTAR